MNTMWKDLIKKKSIYILSLIGIFLYISGCGVVNDLRYNVTYERNYPNLPNKEYKGYSRSKARGIFHTIKKDETLYSIAKTYRVSPIILKRKNHISDPTEIPLGYQLWIPGARKELRVDTSNTRKLQYASQRINKPYKRNYPQREHTTLPRYTSNSKYLWPVEGGVVTSKFGFRRNKKHDGLDIGAPIGRRIYAVEKGKVIFSGYGPTGYGKLVLIKHDNRMVTVYAHCSLILARKGQMVQKGQVIAKVGNTGRSTGPHLHFEVRVDRKPRNPLKYIPSTPSGVHYAKK
ncbi:MAG: M23 family metallopeptidase [Nitrospinae bacterium]|nr:M23 family metallopeptidase [Nitrospinota bacterium]